MTMQVETAKTIDFSAKSLGPAPWLRPQRVVGNRHPYDTALRTIAVLQTTLELEPLVRLFSREVSSAVTHSSVQYRNGMRLIDLTVGRSARYRRSFRLIVEREELGRLTFTRGKPFTTRETALLEYFLSSLIYPLRNALQYENAFQASLTDPLTGVYNRSMMEAALRREVSLARRYGTPLSLIVIDIDGLKAVNDQYGHSTGDCLIQAVADCVSGSLRKTDIFSRFGGDEFALILSNTNRRGATVLAETIRRHIAGVTRLFDGKMFKVTVSMGVASLAKKDDEKRFFARADKALYRAKGAGRNCVKVASAR
ncbi:MAG: GGDEF domain-containing protein [Acidiferrobacterales bacterium]